MNFFLQLQLCDDQVNWKIDSFLCLKSILYLPCKSRTLCCFFALVGFSDPLSNVLISLLKFLLKLKNSKSGITGHCPSAQPKKNVTSITHFLDLHGWSSIQRFVFWNARNFDIYRKLTFSLDKSVFFSVEECVVNHFIF